MQDKPITYDPNWQESCKSQLLTAMEAAKKIRPGQRIFIGPGTAEPLELVSALSKRAAELPGTDIIQEGLGDYTPIHLSDLPHLFDSGQLPLDVALIQVTPPDQFGMCSFGVSVDIV